MKLLIMSDNHGHWPKVNEIIEKHRPNVDLILHCGDSEFPADDPIWELVDYVVRGNMDFNPQFRLEQVISTDEGNILLLHGHLSGVNMNNLRLIDQAKEQNCQFIFHGHTHALYTQMKGGIYIANPGSISSSRGKYPEKTYLIVEVSENTITSTYFDLQHQEIQELSHTYQR